jgi:hypothetical protein
MKGRVSDSANVVDGYIVLQDKKTGEPMQEQYDVLGEIKSMKFPKKGKP